MKSNVNDNDNGNRNDMDRMDEQACREYLFRLGRREEWSDVSRGDADADGMERMDDPERLAHIFSMARRQDWGGICLSFQPLVLKLAKQFKRAGVEFLDLCQEGNLAIAEVLRRYREGKVSLQWLVRTVQWRVTQRMARYARKMERFCQALELSSDIEAVAERSALKDAAMARVSTDIRDAFERALTELEQDVCHAYYAGMPLREIAEHLGVSPQTMSADWAEIRRKLRLAQDGKFDDKASGTETRGRKRKPRGGRE